MGSVFAPVNGQAVNKVASVDMLKDDSCTATTVTTSSQTLEELIGEALPDDVMAVTVVATSVAIRYNPSGAADATNGLIPDVYTIWGQKAVLDLAEFYAGTSTAMAVIVHVPNFTATAD